MKGIMKHCFVFTLFIFCLESKLLGQVGNSQGEYTFILQDMENGHTNISWEGACNDGVLGYIFSLYNELGGLEEYFQVTDSNVSVVLGENYSWNLEEVEVSSIVGYIEDLPDIQVTGEEIELPIKGALTWYQGELEIDNSTIESSIYDEMELEVEFFFGEDDENVNDITNIASLQNWSDMNLHNDLFNANYIGTLESGNNVKWWYRSSDTLTLEVDYRIRYSAAGVEEQETNIASATLIFINDYSSKAELGGRTTLDIYPTVFSDQLNWIYHLTDEDALSFDFFDANGRHVYNYQALEVSEGAYQQNLSTANWNAGNYYCVIKCNDKIEKRQLMKLP